MESAGAQRRSRADSSSFPRDSRAPKNVAREPAGLERTLPLAQPQMLGRRRHIASRIEGPASSIAISLRKQIPYDNIASRRLPPEEHHSFILAAERRTASADKSSNFITRQPPVPPGVQGSIKATMSDYVRQIKNPRQSRGLTIRAANGHFGSTNLIRRIIRQRHRQHGHPHHQPFGQWYVSERGIDRPIRRLAGAHGGKPAHRRQQVVCVCKTIAAEQRPGIKMQHLGQTLNNRVAAAAHLAAIRLVEATSTVPATCEFLCHAWLSATKCFRNRWRARLTRERTVPSGTPNASAVSWCVSSPTTTNSKDSRNSFGS